MTGEKKPEQIEFGAEFTMGSSPKDSTWNRGVRFYERTDRFGGNTEGFAYLVNYPWTICDERGRIASSGVRHSLVVRYVPRFLNVDTQQRFVSDLGFTEVEIPVELWRDRERRLAEAFGGRMAQTPGTDSD